MLSRSKIYHKVELGKDAKKVFIFCEGDREYYYFNYFVGFSSNIDIIPVPNENGQSDPEKLYQNACVKLLGSITEKPKYDFKKEMGDEVWFVIDTDRWNEHGKIEKLKAKCASDADWRVAQSNPCFEIWLYFHFHPQKPISNEIEECTSFKEFVGKKIPGGFDSTKYPIYFQKAIKHSKGNFVKENDQPKFLSTEVFYVAESILPFIKEIIDELLAKHSI